MKKYITVLDFELGKVFQYRLNPTGPEWESEGVEEYLANKGHNLQNCEWMVHNYNKIITE